MILLKVAVAAGHTLFGAGTGAVSGRFKESYIARDITMHIINELKRKGHKVTECTINSSGSQSQYLKDQVNRANNSGADLFLCVHLNACESHQGNGSEIYTWNGKEHKEAVKILNNLKELGFKKRGVKSGNSFYVIKKTKMKALLLEVFFLDNKHDQELYTKLGAEKIGKTIANSI